MDQHIILNFEGIDGATSWAEEAHALEPDPATLQNCEIDTAQYYAGSSSLLMATGSESGWACFHYRNIADIDTMKFSLKGRFMISNFLEDNDNFNFRADSSISATSWIDFQVVRVSIFGPPKILPLISGFDYEGTEFGPWYDEDIEISQDVWHQVEIIVVNRNVTLKIDGVEMGTITAAIDNPMKNIDIFSAGCYQGDVAGAKAWLDSVVFESGDENAVSIPAASMTLTPLAPYRHDLIPVADMTFFTLAPDFGSLFASIPAGVFTLLARNPSPIWTIPSNKLATAQIIYKCILTGSEDGLTDLTLPMKSFQARLRDGDPSYLSCVIPDSTTYAASVAARTNGEIVIYSGYKFDDGTEQTEEIIRANYDSLQINRGANSGSLTISGYKTITSSSPKEWTVTGISFYGQTAEGKRRIRANFDQFIRCGDTCIYGTGGNDYFIVGAITCWVTAKPAGYFMEASEA